MTHLKQLDVLQSSFLHALGLTDKDGFLQHNVAPLQLRRDISVLGFLCKAAKGRCHPDVADMFPLSHRIPSHSTRSATSQHIFCLHDPLDGRQSDLMNRSISAASRVFKRFALFVTVTTVKGFSASFDRSRTGTVPHGRAELASVQL